MDRSHNVLSLDFAALRTLHFVFELGSFSEAAEALGQTQSNVSYTMSRLRDCFNDPLFVREGRAVVSTERCRVIVAETSDLLETFQTLVSPASFEPATAKGNVTIACNHYERLTVLPQFIKHLRNTAPGITLKVINSLAFGEDLLKRGECDLLLGPIPFRGEAVFKRHMRTDSYCCIMAPHNPLCHGPLTLDKIASANHVALRFSATLRPFYFPRFEAEGVFISPVVELTEYGDMGSYVRDSDLIAIVPIGIADRLDPTLVRKKIPIDVPIVFDQYWTRRTHQSPLHKWVRDAVADAAKQTEIGGRY
ncbi:MAG: LysR family transcriptional regulator [Rhodobacteraceae bacterium]|nr:LysR family transcriptional regulator [Paracoccaceae bacterium]